MQRKLLLFPLALLLLPGCQPGAPTTTELSRLQSRVQAQQDSLQKLRAQLHQMRQELEVAAVVANQVPRGGPTARVRSAAPHSSGRLYQRPAVTRLPDDEMAEVLSWADTTSSISGEVGQVQAYLVCNGPADASVDECNCSHYLYLALSNADYSDQCKLYRVGPFFLPEFRGWTQDSASQTLRIRHDIKGRKKTDVFRISWAGVRLL